MIQKSSESVVDHNYNDAQVCAFDYFLNGIPFEYVAAFTLKSISSRLVIHGNLFNYLNKAVIEVVSFKMRVLRHKN